MDINAKRGVHQKAFSQRGWCGMCTVCLTVYVGHCLQSEKSDREFFSGEYQYRDPWKA